MSEHKDKNKHHNYYEGEIVYIGKIFDVTAKLAKRDIVIHSKEGKWTNEIKFQLLNDYCNIIESYEEGDSVRVYFDVKGFRYRNREGKEQLGHNVNAWRIERI